MDDNIQNTNNGLTSGVSDNSVGGASVASVGNSVTDSVADSANLQQNSQINQETTVVTASEGLVTENETLVVENQERKSLTIDENFKADVDISTSTNEDREEDSESYMDDTGNY